MADDPGLRDREEEQSPCFSSGLQTPPLKKQKTVETQTLDQCPTSSKGKEKMVEIMQGNTKEKLEEHDSAEECICGICLLEGPRRIEGA
ncbi:hypothetical protein AMTR_s00006p00252420 [Amborella trichopoda]|uniref:Uncharacterized protein n=1 Tax=Amborella trichopoda TaxID=13333 RepID=W1PDI9_AMBTC|nr:hypothetical protein AMTR_s00006p00252420 [Amborella trichopoda]